MHRRYAEELDNLRALAAVTLIRRVPDRATTSQAADHLFDVAFLDRVVSRPFAAATLQLSDEIVVIFPKYRVERRTVLRENATTYFKGGEMSAQQNDPLAILYRLVQMLDALHGRDRARRGHR